MFPDFLPSVSHGLLYLEEQPSGLSQRNLVLALPSTQPLLQMATSIFNFKH